MILPSNKSALESKCSHKFVILKISHQYCRQKSGNSNSVNHQHFQTIKKMRTLKCLLILSAFAPRRRCCLLIFRSLELDCCCWLVGILNLYIWTYRCIYYIFICMYVRIYSYAHRYYRKKKTTSLTNLVYINKQKT